ncbi:MAG: SCO family protein [gamma proteobacterium symbiont of Bathyaustriella thionipta]|nr:SCO family protein [gamma proteobacterium symbiont of Bathyaustriella thionipta]
MNNELEKSGKQSIKGRKTFLLMLLVFGLPNVLAWLYYNNLDSLPKPATSNRGQLVQPLRSLSGLEFQDIDGRIVSINELQGKWILLTAAHSGCQQDCQQQLYFMRQIRRLMGEQSKDIVRIMVLNDVQALPQLRQTLQDYKGMMVLAAPEDQISRIMEILSVDNINPLDSLFIVDPQANVMMLYRPGEEPKDVAEDLRRLLKVIQKA